MKTTSTLIAAITVALFSGHAMALTKAEYEAGKDRIKAEYKADKETCKPHSGNAKDVCEEQAKGKEKIAKAELEAQYKPTPRNQEKARVAKADAAFDIAKEKCDDLNGDPKQACEKDAKAVHESALKAARAK